MSYGSIAKRYATALLRVAQESGTLAAIQADLDKLVRTVEAHPDLRQALESPVVPESKKQGIFAGLQQKLGLGEAVQNLMRILIDHDRVAALPMLGLLFRDMADEVLGQVRVQVKVAAPLGEQEKQLEAVLAKSLGRKVLLETTVDPSLLGGLWVQVADQVLDASLKRELERIQASIVKRAVA